MRAGIEERSLVSHELMVSWLVVASMSLRATVAVSLRQLTRTVVAHTQPASMEARSSACAPCSHDRPSRPILARTPLAMRTPTPSCSTDTRSMPRPLSLLPSRAAIALASAIAAGCAAPAPVPADAPATGTSVWTVDLVRTLPGAQADYLASIEANWARARRIARTQGAVLSYRALATAPDSTRGWDVLLMTEYADSSAWERREEIFQAIFAAPDYVAVPPARPSAEMRAFVAGDVPMRAVMSVP